MGDVWRHVRTCRGCSHGLRRRNRRQETQGSLRRCRNGALTEAVTPAGADNEPEPGPAEAATTDPSQVGGGPSDPESLNPNGASGARSRVRLDNPNSPSPSTPVTARQPAHDNVPIRVQPRRNAPKPRRFLQSLVFVNSKRLSADRSYRPASTEPVLRVFGGAHEVRQGLGYRDIAHLLEDRNGCLAGPRKSARVSGGVAVRCGGGQARAFGGALEARRGVVWRG